MPEPEVQRRARAARCGPSRNSSASPPTTGGSTSGSSTTERSTGSPRSRPRASTTASGPPNTMHSAVEIAAVSSESRSASSAESLSQQLRHPRPVGPERQPDHRQRDQRERQRRRHPEQRAAARRPTSSGRRAAAPSGADARRHGSRGAETGRRQRLLAELAGHQLPGTGAASSGCGASFSTAIG